MKSITVIVAKDGQIQIEAKGFQGIECQLASKFLREALGPIREERLKPEFHQNVQQQTVIRPDCR